VPLIIGLKKGPSQGPVFEWVRTAGRKTIVYEKSTFHESHCCFSCLFPPKIRHVFTSVLIQSPLAPTLSKYMGEIREILETKYWQILEVQSDKRTISQPCSD